jgi:hypothetical protein
MVTQDWWEAGFSIMHVREVGMNFIAHATSNEAGPVRDWRSR